MSAVCFIFNATTETPAGQKDQTKSNITIIMLAHAGYDETAKNDPRS